MDGKEDENCKFENKMQFFDTKKILGQILYVQSPSNIKKIKTCAFNSDA